jgi:hypothetical protein
VPVAPLAVDLIAPGLSPLLAAGWIDSLGPLLVVGFWIIRQVYVAVQEQRELERAKQEAAERGEPWPPRPIEPELPEPLGENPPVVMAGDQPAQPKAPPQDDLRSEIEEFLRRAGMPAPAAPAAPPPPAAEDRPRPPRRQLDPFDEPPRKPRPPKQRPPVQRPRPVATPTPPRTQAKPEGAGSTQGLRRLPESQLAEQAAHLGEQIAQSDDRLEARLHDKFDHRLGNLEGAKAKPATKAAEAPSAAGRIRGMLTRPGGVRDAIILSEILRRPSDD